MDRTKRWLAESEDSNIVKFMANGDHEASEFLEKYIAQDAFALTWIDVLKMYDVRGNKIVTLFKCCYEDVGLFTDTLMALDKGSYGNFYEQRRILKNTIRNKTPFPFRW